MNLRWISELFQSIDWATLSNIAVIISVLFIIRQLRETRYTTHAQAYSSAVDILQEEKVRKARKIIFTLTEKPLSIWTTAEIEAAEIVCYTYDVVGQMTRHRLLPKEIVIDSWGSSLRNSWPILSQLIIKYRNDFHASEYWDDYEWLVVESVKFNKHRIRINRLKTGYYVRQAINPMKSGLNDLLARRKARKTINKKAANTGST